LSKIFMSYLILRFRFKPSPLSGWGSYFILLFNINNKW
jgi:hypothetical protein